MNTVQKVSLFFKDNSSDKEYNAQLLETVGGYAVMFQYGRRGSSLTSGTKTPTPVSQEAATKIYNKLVAEKMGKGYKPGDDSGNFIQVAGTPDTKEVFFVPQLLNPIDESEVLSYLKDDSYGAQEKKDGRHQAFSKKAGKVQVTNKKGQAIGYPAALEKAIQTNQDLLVDSEAIGDVFHTFDLLELHGEDLRKLGYRKRYDVLKSLFYNYAAFAIDTISLVPLAIGYKEKKALYDNLKAAGKEGIVFKKLDAPHTPGRPASGGPMIKCKFYGELSARVCQGREGKRSIGLELMDSKENWINVGNCTIPQNKEVPSIFQVVEIRYLYALKGGSLYQPIYKEVRDDVNESECLMTQIKYKSEED